MLIRLVSIFMFVLVYNHDVIQTQDGRFHVNLAQGRDGDDVTI